MRLPLVVSLPLMILADQATDDIADIEGLGTEKAGQLIMKARESWFN